MLKVKNDDRRILPFAATAALLLITFSATSGSADQRSCPISPTPKGAWAQEGGQGQFLFEPERVVVRQDGEFRAATILRREPCKLVVLDGGLRSTWTLKGNERTLHLDLGKGDLELVPLPSIPASLDINPFPLPPPQPVPAAKVQEITQELTSRVRHDQETVSTPEVRNGILIENGHYLREVVGQYGWIDIPRFGKPAAAAAVVVLKHADDVPLMQAAVPIVERDAKENGGGKELVSVLVDALLLSTGHKQKYGTQLTEDANGKPFVIPVENLAKVEEYRKALGILSWSDYLKRASEVLYAGVPIRLPTPDE